MKPSTALIFFTVHNRKGLHNPWAAEVVQEFQEQVVKMEELRQQGWTGVVLDSPVGPLSVAPGGTLLAGCDVDSRGFGVNLWSPGPSGDPTNPDWVQSLANGAYIAVTEKCVAFPSRIEDAVRQIITMFSRDFVGAKGREYPWGPASRGQRTTLEKAGARFPTTSAPNEEGRSRHLPYFAPTPQRHSMR